MKKIIRAGAVAATSMMASSVAALEIGAPAPDFTVTSTHGEIVLSQVLSKGPVILAYYRHRETLDGDKINLLKG